MIVILCTDIIDVNYPTLTWGLLELYAAKYKKVLLVVKESLMAQYADILAKFPNVVVETISDNISYEDSIVNFIMNYRDVEKIFLNTVDSNMQLLLVLSRQYPMTMQRVYGVLHHPIGYPSNQLAMFKNHFIVLTNGAYQMHKSAPNVHYIPLPCINLIEDRTEIEKPVFTFCSTGRVIPTDITHQHNRYDNYMFLKVCCQKTAEFLENDKFLSAQELLEHRQRATHNILLLGPLYCARASSALIDSFVYLLPIVSYEHPLIEEYRHGLDIGLLLKPTQDIKDEIRNLVENFDKERYIHQINNLKMLRDYYSGKSLADRVQL